MKIALVLCLAGLALGSTLLVGAYGLISKYGPLIDEYMALVELGPPGPSHYLGGVGWFVWQVAFTYVYLMMAGLILTVCSGLGLLYLGVRHLMNKRKHIHEHPQLVPP